MEKEKWIEDYWNFGSLNLIAGFIAGFVTSTLILINYQEKV